MQPSLTITVRGEQHKAERLTKTNYVALGSLIWEKGKQMPDLDQYSVKKEVAERMMVKFSDPDFIKKLSYSMLAIFPTLANGGLVWFYPTNDTQPPFGINMEPEEILQIITEVSNALAPSVKEAIAVQTQSQAERDRTEKIAQLKSAIASLETEDLEKSPKTLSLGFGKKND